MLGVNQQDWAAVSPGINEMIDERNSEKADPASLKAKPFHLQDALLQMTIQGTDYTINLEAK